MTGSTWDGIWVWGCGRICGEMCRISCTTRMSTARSRGSARTRKAMLQLHAFGETTPDNARNVKCSRHCCIAEFVSRRPKLVEMKQIVFVLGTIFTDHAGNHRVTVANALRMLAHFSEHIEPLSMIQHLQMPTQCAAKQLRMQLASNCIVHIMIHVTCGMPLQRGTLAAGCIVDSEHGANMLQFICKWFANAFASCSQCCGCLHCPVDSQTSHGP